MTFTYKLAWTVPEANRQQKQAEKKWNTLEQIITINIKIVE